MYTVDQIRRGLGRGVDTPALFGRELNRLYHRRLGTWDYNERGVSVMDEDWDTLVLLDACRYDVFRSRHRLPGRLEARQSRGSHTVEFLRGNVAEGRFDDTVYVTASPQFYRNRDELNASFHAVVDIWRTDGWDEDHGTVLPGTTTEHALRAHRRYPNKRLVVHYLQPHYPFIGCASDINTRLFGETEDAPDIWGNLMQGTIDVASERLWDAYERNLDLAFEALEPLLAEIDGKTVVSADHGNMLGERASPIPIREWGHPPGVYTDHLVTVPWHVHESGPRRRVVAGETVADGADVGDKGSDVEEDDVVDRRLRDLGYVEA